MLREKRSGTLTTYAWSLRELSGRQLASCSKRCAILFFFSMLDEERGWHRKRTLDICENVQVWRTCQYSSSKRRVESDGALVVCQLGGKVKRELEDPWVLHSFFSGKGGGFFFFCFSFFSFFSFFFFFFSFFFLFFSFFFLFFFFFFFSFVGSQASSLLSVAPHLLLLAAYFLLRPLRKDFEEGLIASGKPSCSAALGDPIVFRGHLCLWLRLRRGRLLDRSCLPEQLRHPPCVLRCGIQLPLEVVMPQEGRSPGGGMGLGRSAQDLQMALHLSLQQKWLANS